MRPFTVIVPAYNEEEILDNNTGKLVSFSNSLSCPHEIIVVSNGSTDRTEAIGNHLEKTLPNVRFFALRDKGVGRAFKKGIEESKYNHIVFMDADLSADLSFIKEANSLLEKNAVVLGTKINGLQNRSLFRKLGSFVFFISVFIVMGLKYADYAPGAKAFRKDFLMKYFKYIDDYTSFVLNLTFIASIKRENIADVSVNCDDRRKSRFNLWREAGSKYGGLLSLKIRHLLGSL